MERTIVFLAKRPIPGGRTLGLIRLVDGAAEEWFPDGWKPAGLEWSGIGGSTDWDAVTPEEAVLILRSFGAKELNPVL
jgi:hypothetical protein